MPCLDYTHVDVFSREPYSGNSLPVFMRTNSLSASQMLRITQELRHFETIFLEPTDEPNRYCARIFDLFEELPFAGHPIIGAASALHARCGSTENQNWRFDLSAKSVTITTEKTATGYFGWLDQGSPEFLGVVDDRDEVAAAFSLKPDDIRQDMPMEIVSTGLRYLIIPVTGDVLEEAHITTDITPMLRRHGAQFAVLFDELALEVRHWNNDGMLEDVGTGSAAGTIGAYRLRHGLATGGATFILNQGRHTGRPSELHVRAEGNAQAVSTVLVGGDVALVGTGKINTPPEISK